MEWVVKVHSDYFVSGDSDYSHFPLTGERIATFMTYLDAPKSGNLV